MDADAIFFKEPSFLHSKFERSEIREITREVKEQFGKLKGDRRKYAYVLSHDYEGFLKTPLPSFWCEELSKVSVDVSVSDGLTGQDGGALHGRSNPYIPRLSKALRHLRGKLKGGGKNPHEFIVMDAEGNEVIKYLRYDSAYGWALLEAKKTGKQFFIQTPNGRLIPVQGREQ